MPRKDAKPIWKHTRRVCEVRAAACDADNLALLEVCDRALREIADVLVEYDGSDVAAVDVGEACGKVCG